MAWQMLWPLILGFAISGAIQAVVRRNTVALDLVALTLVSCGSDGDEQPSGEDQQRPSDAPLVIDEIAADPQCTAEGTLEMTPNGSAAP